MAQSDKTKLRLEKNRLADLEKWRAKDKTPPVEKMSVKELLSWLHKLYGFLGGKSEGAIPEDAVFSYNIDELKAELAKRGHLPNKVETKAIRQARAKGLSKEEAQKVGSRAAKADEKIREEKADNTRQKRWYGN